MIELVNTMKLIAVSPEVTYAVKQIAAYLLEARVFVELIKMSCSGF